MKKTDGHSSDVPSNQIEAECNLDESRRNFMKSALVGSAALSVMTPWQMAEAQVAGRATNRTIRGVGVAPGVVQISSNENPLGASPRAIEAVLRHMGSSNRYYRSSALESAIANLHELDYEPPRRVPGQPRRIGPILMAAGSGQVLHSLARTYFENAGDEMVAAVPSYGSIERDWEEFGGVVHRVPLKDYRHDLTAMLAKVHRGTKMVSICNPNNPTGTIVPYHEVESFINEVPEQVLVVVDEAYVEFVGDQNYRTSISLAATRKNVMSIRTFSKIFGLAGVRVGYAIAHPDVNEKMSKYHYDNGISLYGKVAAEAALTDYSHQRNSRRLAIEMKAYFAEQFADMGLEYVPSESSFMMVNLNRDARPVGRALAERKISVADAERRWDMKGWMRVSVGTREESEAFVTALREILTTAL
jgi:histidinol-phosphate aminotransferase